MRIQQWFGQVSFYKSFCFVAYVVSCCREYPTRMLSSLIIYCTKTRADQSLRKEKKKRVDDRVIVTSIRPVRATWPQRQIDPVRCTAHYTDHFSRRLDRYVRRQLIDDIEMCSVDLVGILVLGLSFASFQSLVLECRMFCPMPAC